MSQTNTSPAPASPPVAARELVSDGVDGIRTTRMLERAVREKWPIPDAVREAIIKRQAKIAIDVNSSPREATSAARALISAASHNLEIVKMEIAEESRGEANKHVHVHFDGTTYRPPIKNVIVHRPAPAEPAE